MKVFASVDTSPLLISRGCHGAVIIKVTIGWKIYQASEWVGEEEQEKNDESFTTDIDNGIA